ncbi:MAG: glycosyltransferase family 2 protein, partial [Bacteroidota bacterium]
MSPFFSIIIPTYNRAAYLPHAIKSVMDQVFADWELLIVDDGSTDDTRKVVQPFLSDERIRYHWQENRELNGARNTGVRLARGRYIAFLDDDDQYLVNHLSVLANYLKEKGYPIAAVRTGMYIQVTKKQWTKPPLLQVKHQHRSE